MPKRFGKSRKSRTSKVFFETIDQSCSGGFKRGELIIFSSHRARVGIIRTTAPNYKETIKHVGSFGTSPGKANYFVLTYHDVLHQLLQRELNHSSIARCQQLFYFIDLEKTEARFRKEVPVKKAYGMHKGERVEVGWTCSKKKAQKWFRRNLNRLLGKDDQTQ